jgi:hypothetical protein
MYWASCIIVLMTQTVAVFEPNLFIVKNFIVPVAIVEKVYRYFIVRAMLL